MALKTSMGVILLKEKEPFGGGTLMGLRVVYESVGSEKATEEK